MNVARFRRRRFLINKPGRFYRQHGRRKCRPTIFGKRSKQIFSAVLRLSLRDSADEKTRAAGSIINISSLAGQNAHPRMAAYNASKFGLEWFFRALMQEVVRITLISYICPGSVIPNSAAMKFRTRKKLATTARRYCSNS